MTHLLTLLILTQATPPYFEKPAAYNPSDPSISAFNQLKVVTETPVLSLSFQYGINTDRVTTTTANSATVTQANSRALLTTGTNAAGSAALQSNTAIRYVPGQGIRARFTATFTTCVANSRQEIGVGDSNDGFFFGCNGASFGIMHRNAGAETVIPFASWNGSKPTFNVTKGNVYAITYQWLGYGVIRFYLERSNGEFVLVHQIDYPNSATLPSLGNPQLRFWAKAVNSGNTSSLVLAVPSVGIVSEGPPPAFGFPNGYAARKAISSTITNVVSLQNKATFSSVTNKVRIRVTSLYLSASGSGDVTCTLRKGATVGGVPSFADNAATSIASLDSAGTTVTGGRIMFGMVFEGANATRTSTLEIFIEPGEILTLACASQTGSPTVGVGLNWSEEFSG